MSVRSRITAEVHAGWREPLFALANALRAGGLDDKWLRDWEAAASAADRTVSVTAWATALQPSFDVVDLGMQPVLVASGRPDRSGTRARFHDRRSLEAREYSYARLTVQVPIPRQWVRLPGAVFRLRATAAILDALDHLGRSAGIGAPPLRARSLPLEPETDPAALLRTGRWWNGLREKVPPGHVVVAARPARSADQQAHRDAFLAALGAAQRVTPDDEFEAWRIGPLS